MFKPFAARIRAQLPELIEQYDIRLREVPGYSQLPQAARLDLERRVLELVADGAASGVDTPLIDYVQERAEFVLARGFQPEWFQQAVTVAQTIITPLIKKVDEGNFVWQAMNRVQNIAWQIVSRERQRVELTLRESETRYQTIFNSTPIMFWLKDTHNRTLRINRAAAAFEGVNPADVEGKSCYDVYPREQAEAFYQDDLEVIRSNRPKLGIVEQHTAVGTNKLMWVETGKTPVRNEQGETIGVLAFAVDITERQLAQAKLSQSEAQYRQAITAAGAVPYYIDYSTESYRFIGEAIAQLLGYPIEEVTPALLGGLIQETIMTGQASALMRETAIQQARTGNLTSWNADYRLVDRLGQTVWLHDSSVQILDESGKPVGAIGILQDITERKQTEVSLRHSAELQQRADRYLRATIEATDELTHAPDLDTVYRRTVELAREKFDVERCGLFLIDESGQSMIGTYGTDDQRRTTDEHTAQRLTLDFEDVLKAQQDRYWVVSETPHVFIKDSIEHTVGTGWVANTVVRGATGPIGLLFNDSALSGQPVDETQQEALAVYCSAVGSIIERKRAEEERLAAFEKERIASERLRVVLTATDELTRLTDLDLLYRRTVELAREKLGVERCGLWIVDPAHQFMQGTYGTDDQGRTTDERAARDPLEQHQAMFLSQAQVWVVQEAPQRIRAEGKDEIVGTGWVASTALRGAAGPIGVLYNDSALSGRPVDEAQQEALAVYCSAVGSIIERKRAEDERRAAFENERRASERLRAIVTATDELIRTTDLDVLYRRAVELAREKLGVERCALYILDESREWVLGTFGTDAVGQTTDERSNKEPVQNHQVIFAPREQQWVAFETELKYWEGDQDQVVGKGWNVATPIRSAAGPIGIMFNDAAISRKPYEEGLQQSLALYCSMLANIIENKRLELQIRQSLQQRGAQVQTSTELAQEIAAAPDLDELFRRVVTLIKERFNYYHTQIFRYNPAQESAVLVTGYGEIGRQMVAAGHTLPMGRGVVGSAAATGESILAVDVRQDEDWRPNPYLPNTQSELAVPIQLGSVDAEAQLNALKYFSVHDFDGIAVAALDPAVAAQLTQTVLQQGKAIVAFCNDLGAENQSALVAVPEQEMGRLLGVEAGLWAKRHLPASATVKVGLLTYYRPPAMTVRETGILEGLRSVIGERVDVVACGRAFEAREAAELTVNWLREHPDLDMLLAFNDTAALHAYSTAQSLGWIDPDRFFIGGIDAVPAALTALQEGGVFQATVHLSPEAMGLMIVRALVAAIKGLALKPLYMLDCWSITRANAAEYSDMAREQAVSTERDFIPAEFLSGLDVSGLRLGLSVLSLANPFFSALVKSARAEADRLGVHLSVNDPRRVLGVLDVQSDRIGALTDGDRLLLEGLCGQIAIAIESTRLLEELRRGEADLSKALQIAKLAYWEYDVEKDLFHFNDQFYAIFHTTVEQEGGYQLSSAQYAGKFVYPEDLPVVGAEIERALNSTDRHYSRDVAHRIQYADGGVGYMSVSINIDRDEQGRILRYYGANQDITAAKLAEAELEKFKLGLERSNSAIFITDPQGVISYVNPAFETVYGYSRDEALGQTPRLFKSGVIPQEQYRLFWSTLLSKQTAAGEIINKTKDGRLIPVEASNNPILNEAGEIVGFLGVHTDITQRKRAEEDLDRSAQLLNTIINNSRDLIYIKDTQGRFQVASQAVARLAGARSTEEMIGKTDYDFFPRELAAKYFSDEQKIIQAGEPLIDIEEPSAYPDGTPIWLLTSKIPYRAPDGTLLGILGIGRDITERKRTEERMEESLRETERLYAAVSAEGWQTFRESGQLAEGYRYDRALLQPAEQLWEPEIGQAVTSEKTVVTHTDDRAVTVTPLAVRGTVIGALGVYDNPDRPLQADDLALLEAVSEQVALALESARLFEQTQRDAERERTLNRIASRIRSAQSVNQVLEFAAEELSNVTRASRSVAEIRPGQPALGQSGNGKGNDHDNQ